MSSKLKISSPRRQIEGCICCRLRRKKCDDTQPVCKGCERNRLLCTWPDSLEHHQLTEILCRQRLKDNRQQALDSASTRKEATVPNFWHELRSCPNSSPCTFPATQALAVLSLVPRSSYDFKNFLDTLYVIPKTISWATLARNSVIKDPTSRMLFDHYLHNTHRLITICQTTENPFLSQLLPLSMAHPLVMHGILALTSIHHANRLSEPPDETAWFHYGQAIQGQKYGLTSLAAGDDGLAIPLLVTALLLCITESMRGNNGASALQHIKGARQLLYAVLRLPSSQLSETTRIFLIERYVYMITKGHSAMSTKSDSWVMEDVSFLFPKLQANQERNSEMPLGCVHELFCFIPRVTIYARNQCHDLQRGLQLWQTASEYQSLCRIIGSWKPSSKDESYNLCGLVYQQALIVYLKASHRPSLSHDDQYLTEIQIAFDLFIPLLQSFHVQSSILTTLLWPLVVFGACSTSSEHRNTILESLNTLSSVHAVKSVAEARKVLQHLWTQKSHSATPLSIEAAMKELNMVVLFL